MADGSGGTLRTGSRVAISGLVGAPQHNGKQGTVLRFVQRKGRYAVALAGEAHKLLLKPANMKIMEPLAADDPCAHYGGILEPLPGVGVLHAPHLSLLSCGDLARLLLCVCRVFRRRFADDADAPQRLLLPHLRIHRAARWTALQVSNITDGRCWSSGWSSGGSFLQPRRMLRGCAASQALRWLHTRRHATFYESFATPLVAEEAAVATHPAADGSTPAGAPVALLAEDALLDLGPEHQDNSDDGNPNATVADEAASGAAPAAARMSALAVDEGATAAARQEPLAGMGEGKGADEGADAGDEPDFCSYADTFGALQEFKKTRAQVHIDLSDQALGQRSPLARAQVVELQRPPHRPFVVVRFTEDAGAMDGRKMELPPAQWRRRITNVQRRGTVVGWRGRGASLRYRVALENGALQNGAAVVWVRPSDLRLRQLWRRYGALENEPYVTTPGQSKPCSMVCLLLRVESDGSPAASSLPQVPRCTPHRVHRCQGVAAARHVTEQPSLRGRQRRRRPYAAVGVGRGVDGPPAAGRERRGRQ